MELYSKIRFYKVFQFTSYPGKGMEIEEEDYPCFEVMIEEDHMKRSVFVTGQEIYFPDKDLMIDNNGIFKISDPHSKIDRIKIDTKNLQELELIGTGSTAQVRRAIYLANGNQYVFAVKSINAVQPDERKQLLNDLREYLTGQYCENVVEFYTCFFKEGLVKQVIEYMDMGTLKGLIKLIRDGKVTLSEQEIATVMQKILQGLHHIHSVRHSIHRDIKPENILVNSQGEIKITDFGVSKCIENTKGRSVVGSIIYMSPERLSLQTESYSYKSDIWSVGLVMYELATGKINPYADLKGGKVNYFKMSLKILESPAPELPGGQFSAPMYDFFNRCVTKNEQERASAELLLSHPWIVDNKLPNLSGLIQRIRLTQQ